MNSTIKQASNNKLFAYKNAEGEEIILGERLYLGVNDDGSRYYEVEKIEETFDNE